MTEFLHGDREFDGPSKTQVKQEMHALQELGAELLKLSNSELDLIGVAGELRAALREHGRMPTREARRRHLQFIGRLLREGDSEPIQERLTQLRAGQARALSQAEQWRERLIDQDSAMTQWVEQYPHTDIQSLRALVRNARKELERLENTASDKPAAKTDRRHSRQLFQTLRELVESAE